MTRKKVMAFLKNCTCTYFKVRRGTNGLMEGSGSGRPKKCLSHDIALKGLSHEIDFNNVDEN